MGLFIKDLTEFIQSVGIILFRKITWVSALSLRGSLLRFDSEQYLLFSLLSINSQLLLSELTFAEVPGCIFRLKKEEADKFLVTGYMNAQCALSLLKIIFPSLGVGHGPLTVRIWHSLTLGNSNTDRECGFLHVGARNVSFQEIMLMGGKYQACWLLTEATFVPKLRKYVKSRQSSEAVTPARLPAERERVISRTV